MRGPKRNSAEWRAFEQLVARLEADCRPRGLTIKSPDRIRCKVTGQLREVDASIRTSNEGKDTLVTIECRKRRKREDVTWIEQLATKKASIGADHTIAVSAAGFSDSARVAARAHGIALRQTAGVSADDINCLLRLDFVLFAHKRCAIVRVGLRYFCNGGWTVPGPNEVDLTLPGDADPFAHVFRNIETGATWCLNDLWLQIQEATDPFLEIERGQPPVIRTAAFPYPGNVSIDTSEGPKVLGDVLLSVALWIEVERVGLDQAQKSEYGSADLTADFPAVQRVEFTSSKSPDQDWSVSLQAPRDARDASHLRAGGNWPKHKRS